MYHRLYIRQFEIHEVSRSHETPKLLYSLSRFRRSTYTITNVGKTAHRSAPPWNENGDGPYSAALPRRSEADGLRASTRSRSILTEAWKEVARYSLRRRERCEAYAVPHCHNWSHCVVQDDLQNQRAADAISAGQTCAAATSADSAVSRNSFPFLVSKYRVAPTAASCRHRAERRATPSRRQPSSSSTLR